jgi:hypothetical protein
MGISGQRQPTAFSTWMRTGRWPRVEAAQGVEVKFNPWHDPRNGRFTFGPGGPQSQDRKQQDPIGNLLKEDPSLKPITTIEEADAWRERLLRQYGHLRRYREAIEARYQLYKSKVPPRRKSVAQQAIEFYTGEAEALRDISEGTIVTAYNLATKPGPTIRNAAIGLAQTVDAIITDDTPAYVYFDRAAKWLQNASLHDLGYALGAGAGNIALTIVPGAMASKLSTVLRARKVRSYAPSIERATPRKNFDIYEILTEQPISGTSRAAHRASANRNLYNYLQKHPELAKMLDTELNANVLAHMSSGKKLRNPPGAIWHHPAHNPNVAHLLRRAEHTNPLTQPALHPNGVGGFGAHYGN